MTTKNKRILIVSLITSLLLVFLMVFYLTREPAMKPPQEGGWALENQSSFVKSALSEYLKQDASEPEEKRKKRLQKYLTDNSPVLEDIELEIGVPGATKSLGQVIDLKECHEQEGGNLCLLANTSVDYYDGREKLETKNKVYWITINYIEGVGFRIYDLGIWDFDYDEELF
jgi:hypothetical protein